MVDLNLGFTNILIVAPVASDLSTCVEKMEEDKPGIFGPGGAYGQVFALFNCSMAAATMFGPVVAGAIKEQYGWKAMSVAMGIFSISGAVPTASLRTLYESPGSTELTCLVLLYGREENPCGGTLKKFALIHARTKVTNGVWCRKLAIRQVIKNASYVP